MSNLVQILVFSQAEVTSNGVVQVRMDNQIHDNSVVPTSVIASGNYIRHVIIPGQSYDSECEQVKAICSVVHTPAVISAYQEMIAAQQSQIDSSISA